MGKTKIEPKHVLETRTCKGANEGWRTRSVILAAASIRKRGDATRQRKEDESKGYARVQSEAEAVGQGGS